MITNLTTTSGRLLSEQDGHRQAIAGAGIAPGTTIVSVIGTEAVLSKPATVAGKAVALTATGPQAVHRQLTGLAPQSAYRYRVLAANAEEAASPAEAFATYPLVGPLPDGRGWELVSPAEKTGEVIPGNANTGLGGSCVECVPGENVATMPMQSAPGGEAVLYEGQPFAAGLSSLPNSYLSARGGAGWDWQSLSPAKVLGAWQGFSADLARGVLFQEEPPLSPAAPTRGGHAFANLYLRQADGALVPLLTSEPPHRDPGRANFANKLRLRYSGANAGTAASQPFSHVVFEANDALTEAVAGTAPAAPEVGAGAECTERRLLRPL